MKKIDAYLKTLTEGELQYLKEKLLPSRMWILAYGVLIGLSMALVFFFALEMMNA